MLSPCAVGDVFGDYTQEWLRGDHKDGATVAHVHEGIWLQDGSGWVGTGHTYTETHQSKGVRKVAISSRGRILRTYKDSFITSRGQGRGGSPGKTFPSNF